MTFEIGFDFRGSQEFANDPPGCTHVTLYPSTCLYPQTRSGVTFGFINVPTWLTDNDATLDARLAGYTGVYDSDRCFFRIDLPAPGQFVINLAALRTPHVEVIDADGTIRYTLDRRTPDVSFPSKQFIDATGRVWSGADWALQNKSAAIIATGAHILVALGRLEGVPDPSYKTILAHFRIASIGAVVDAITITPADATLPVGDLLKLTALAHYTDGTQWDVTAFADWASSDVSIAAMNGAQVSAYNKGSVTITATFGGFTGNTTLNVSAPVVISSVPDWSDGIKERTTYSTALLRSSADNEQRMCIRKTPRVRLEFDMLTTEARETQALDAVLWDWQAKRCAAPFWPDATPLQADVVPGASVIQADPSNRKFATGSLAMLYRDEHTFEVVTVDAVHANTIELTAAVGGSWAALNTYVVPLLTGYLRDAVDVTRRTSTVADLSIDIECERDIATPGAPVVVTQYKGLDVLEVEPSFDDPSTRYTRNTKRIESVAGRLRVLDRSGVSVVQARAFHWIMDGREQIKQYRDFVAARKGACVPFWVPSWRADLTLTADVAALSATVTVRRVGYAAHLYGSARCNVAFILANRAKIYRKVIAAVEHPDTDTETLTLDAPVGVLVPAASTVLCFLSLCRLATDESVLQWLTCTVAESTLDFTELPCEVPA